MFRFVFLLPLALGALVPAWAQAPAPVLLGATANGALQTTLHPGWPLLVRVDALHADLEGEAVAPVFISAPEGPWSDALHLTVTDASGAEQDWPLQPGGEQWFGVVLTADAGASTAYWLDGAATALLAPGTYTLTARLDASAIEGFTDASDPQGVPVRITLAAGTETEADARTRTLLEADLSVLKGDEAQALATVEAWLEGHPDDAAALAYRADLLHAAGAYADAEVAFETALRAYRRLNPDLPEPLAALEWARAAAEAAHANDVEVTYGPKGPNHPFGTAGGAEGFALDGIPGAEWLLVPGETYTFHLDGVPDGLAFGFFLDPEAQQRYAEGVDGDGTTVTFSPDEATPPVLYYGHAGVPFSGGVLRVDQPAEMPTPTSPGEPLPPSLMLAGPFPNPASEQTVFTLSIPAAARVRAEAFDVMGRRVSYLLDETVAAGTYTFPFRTDALASGTYIVRVTTGAHRFARLVVVP